MRRFWRSVCSPKSRHQDSLYWYMKKMHGMDYFMRANPTKQWFTRKIHLPYCRWKQNHYYEMFDAYLKGLPCRKRLQTALPRGFLKTTINVGSKMWAQLENPEFATYIGSSDDELAGEIMSSVGPIYKGEDGYAKFHLHYGRWYDPTRSDSKSAFVHAARRNLARKEPSFKIFSITTGYKGHHPEIAELDDPVDREKLKNDGTAHLNVANTSVIATRPAMPECSIQEVTMTRYHDDDPQGFYQHKEGVKSWTGHPPWDPRTEITARGEWHVYHIQARDPDTKETVEPMLNTTADLDAYEAGNVIEFWNQMMNQPARGDHMGLDITQLSELWVDASVVRDIPGDYIICVDTAFKEDPQTVAIDACESAFVIAKEDARPNKADYYIVECYTSRTDRIEDFTEKLVMKIQEYQAQGKRIKLITDERSPGKIGAWFHYLINICHSKGILCPPTLEIPRGGGNRSKKIRRLRVAAGFWVDGRVKVIRGGPGLHKLLSQMSRFEVSKIIDAADAGADLFHPDVYLIQTALTQPTSYGIPQRGPDDDELLGPEVGRRPEDRGSPDIIDTILFNNDPWS